MQSAVPCSPTHRRSPNPGTPDFESVTWWASSLPLARCKTIIARLHAETVKALGTSDEKERFATLGAEISEHARAVRCIHASRSEEMGRGHQEHRNQSRMNAHFPRLFEPIRIGSKEARNRVMRLATVTNTGANGVSSRHTIEHYCTVARGGAGMIVTEAMRVHPSNAGRAAAILLYREETIASLRELTEAVHAEGALFIAQLNHGGRQHHAHEIPTVWGPSAIACPQAGGVPHVMTKAEIADVVAGFATAARHAKLAGFDGVEVHGAQGHLIQQFVSPFSNQRDDDYGGALENRLRFPLEILAAVRAQVGPDFIVGYRMGVEEFTPGGVTVDESKVAAWYSSRHRRRSTICHSLKATSTRSRSIFRKRTTRPPRMSICTRR